MEHVRARAIAFDLFHTLVDPEEFRVPPFRRSIAVARLLGLPEDAFDAYWNAQSAARQLVRSPTVVERVQAFCRAQGVTPPPDVWPRVDELLGRTCDQAIRHPRRAARTALGELRRRGWTLGLLSNCDEREHRAWPESPLAPFFHAAVFSCDIGHAKPSPEAYAALPPRWGGVPLRDAIFVGDGNGGELAGARAAGFARVIFQSGFVAVNGLRPAAENERIRRQSDVTISDLRELLDILPAPEHGR